MNIIIGSDHAGFELKKEIINSLKTINFIDVGCKSKESVDYPDFAHLVAKEVNLGLYDLGILICGSGQGVCMTANKYENVRASLLWNTE